MPQQASEGVKTHLESEIHISRRETDKNREKRGESVIEVRKEIEE